MKSCVYAIRNTVNDKRYIGSSVNLNTRKAQHIGMLRSGKHHSPILQNAWNKYGETCFVFEVLEEVEPLYRALKDREQHYLDTMKPEYNISDIADGHFRLGKKNSPEHRARISKRNLGRLGTNNGKTFSEEHRHKISESRKRGKPSRPVGYHHTPESIEKMRIKASSNIPRIQSYEERTKRAEQMRVRWAALSPEQRACRLRGITSPVPPCIPVDG